MSDPLSQNIPVDAMRRAPFGTNPHLGARAKRTRHRILDAALRVYGEVGVHQASIERIAAEAGCSRAAFYQYFADKDDVLRHLAGQMTLHLEAAVAWLRPVTPDADGWHALRDLLQRWSEVHERHRPVFQAFPSMFETDPLLASDATEARGRFLSAIAARVEAEDIPVSAIENTVDVFLVGLPGAFEDLATMRQVAPSSFPSDACVDAVADAYHRALFGLDETTNVHLPDLPPPPRIPFGPLVRSSMGSDEHQNDQDGVTRGALLDAARASFLVHGFHGTRVDTIAEAAGVSHGTLYTHFDSKEHLAQVLAMSAMRAAADTLQRMPDVAAGARPAELRRWLGEYNRAQAGGTAMIRVWSEALRSSDARAESAPTLDWGRRQLARRLGERGFGDVEIEAAVLLGFLSSLGSRERAPATLDAATHIISRGFFGRTGVD